MHIFICKSVEGIIVPQQSNKEKFFRKLLDSYEDLDKKFKVTIELIEKNVNQQQINFYKAFILKAANHFGNDFNDMEFLLIRFFPNSDDSPKLLKDWTSKELSNFIDQASVYLAEHGFKFE